MSDDRDPGLQAERTQLAWERTAFGALATAALLTLRLPAHSHIADLVAPGGALVLALALIGIGWWRSRKVLPRAGGRMAGAAATVLGAGGAVIALGLVILALILSSAVSAGT